MRIALLIIFELLAIFGIPRAIQEFRAEHAREAALALTAAPVSAVPVKESHPAAPSPPPVKAAHRNKHKAPNLVLVSARGEQHRQDAKAPKQETAPQPEVRAAAKEAPLTKERAPEAVAQPGHDDDYLPPWVREAKAAKPAAAPVTTMRQPIAALAPHGRLHRHRRSAETAYWGNPLRRHRSHRHHYSY